MRVQRNSANALSVLYNEWFAGLSDTEKNGQEELKLDPPKFESEEDYNQRARLARAEFTRRTGVVTEEQQRFNSGRWQGVSIELPCLAPRGVKKWISLVS